MSTELESLNAASNSSQDEPYAFFLLDNQEFGLKAAHVRETILHCGEFTRMPCSMDVLDGLINLRGSIIPIINLRNRFHLDTDSQSEESLIAITWFNGALFGLRFDAISEVVRIRQSDISLVDTSEEDPELCNQGMVSFDGGERIVQLLDLERLFKKYNLPRISNDTDQSRRIFRPRKQDTTFLLNGQEYAIAIEDIREIIKPPPIKQKVLVHHSIKGVINLRGELINIVDLRHNFDLPPEEMTLESRIIILQGDPCCGILVDCVKEVIQYEEDQLLPVPMLEMGQERFLGIVALEDGRNIVKLDSKRLFDDKLIQQLWGNTDLHAEEVEPDPYTKRQNSHMDESCNDIANRVLISFRLENDYAFDITLFHEIIHYSAAIVSLPGLPHYHEGVLNLRDRAISIINLRRYYGLEDYVDVNDSKIIVLNLAGTNFGIMVDEIIEIVKPERMSVERIPRLAANGDEKTGNHVQEGYRFRTISGEEKSLLLYDVEQLIRDITASTKDSLLK
jgi:purine-binding chemotaxis protein CheW